MRSAALTVTDNTSRLRKIHSAAPSITPTNSGDSGGGGGAVMGIDDRRIGVGRGQSRHQPRGNQGRHSEDYPVVVAERHRTRFERQPRDLIRGKVQRPQPGAEADLAAMRAQGRQRRIDKRLG